MKIQQHQATAPRLRGWVGKFCTPEDDEAMTAQKGINVLARLLAGTTERYSTSRMQRHQSPPPIWQPTKKRFASIGLTSRTMLRTLIRSSTARSRGSRALLRSRAALFSTQSGDDAKRPTALAKLHLEDGTTLTGTSFGCHESVEGEVCLCAITLCMLSPDSY